MDYRVIISNLNKKEKEYIKYIDEHIALVQRVWAKFKELNYPEGTEVAIVSMTDKEIKEHDLSKYFGNEFIGYRQFFYPEDGADKDKEKFMQAWNEHQKKNKHHWEYFVIPNAGGKNKVLYMGIVQILCMLSDWTAMSLAKGNSPTEWYKENRERMVLHDATVETIDEFIHKFEEVYKILSDEIEGEKELKGGGNEGK